MTDENQEAQSPEDAVAAPTGKPERNDRIGVENLRVLENIDVNLTVVVGNAEIKIRDLLRLSEGSVIELDRLAGDPLDILVNGTIIARGEIVMVGERFGIRFSEVVDPEKRVETV
jgi:flagellar motor switch protein FliN